MIDNEPVDGSITDNTAAAEATSNQDQASPVTQDAAPQPEVKPAFQDQAEPATQDNSGDGSLTNQTGSQKAAPSEWEVKYHEQQKYLGRLRTEVGPLRQLKQQYEGVDPHAIRAWKQAQEDAQQKNLPMYHRKHPSNPQFQARLGEFRRLQSAYQRAKSPEVQDALRAEMDQFKPEEVQAIQDFHNHRNSTNDRIAEEMAGYSSLEEMIQERVQQSLAQHQEKETARQSVDKWFDDPANQPFVEHTSPAMNEALQAGVPLPYVQSMARMRYELDLLKSRLTGNESVVAAAQERSRSSKANASITRDTSSSARRVDPAAVAKERGIDIGSNAFIELLSELSSKKLI